MKRFVAILLVLLMTMQIPMMTIAEAPTFGNLTPHSDIRTNIMIKPGLNLNQNPNQNLNQILDQNEDGTEEILIDTDEPDTQNLEDLNSDIQKVVENPTTLQCASQKGKPSDLSSYTDKDGIAVDWNNADLRWWFQWDSKTKDIASAVWQVSVVKFADDPSNWKNPAGLVASGTLNSSQKEFYIDFAGFSQTPQKWSQEYTKNTVMPYIKNVLQTNKSRLLTSKNQAAYNSILKKSSQIAASRTNAFAGININNKRELNLKLVEVTKKMATDMNATKKKNYYVRVVPLNGQGKCMEMPGAQREISYGETGSASDNDASIELMITARGGSKDETNPYVILKDIYLDWSSTSWYFLTDSPEGIKNSMVQVSTAPFPSIYDNDWKNPKGLVYQKDSIYGKFILNPSVFAQKKDANKPTQIAYYVRTIFTDDSQKENNNNIYVSNTIKVIYGDMENSTPVQMQVPIPIYRPVISLKEYQPIHVGDNKGCF